jgi:hypothetical protein
MTIEWNCSFFAADAVEPRGAPDGAADRRRVRAAAVGAGDGGGAEPGPGRAVPVALRRRGVRRAQLPLQRGQLHGPDGRRREQALHTRGLRPTGNHIWHVLHCFSINYDESLALLTCEYVCLALVTYI